MPEGTTEQITKAKFWMIVRYEGVTNTSTKHKTYEEARNEATRLTINNPAYHFCILEAIEICGLLETPVDIRKL